MIYNKKAPFHKAIILTIKRRPEKLKNTLKELKKAKINNIEIMYGIDGMIDIDNRENLIKENIIHSNFKRIVWNAGTNGSIGNYLSYIRIFEKIISDTYLILEDDIKVDRTFLEDLDRILINTKEMEWDFLYLGMSNITLRKRGKWGIIKKIGEYTIYDPSVNAEKTNGEMYGNFGLLVKPKAARVWLNGALPMTQASDSRLGSLVTGIKHAADHPTLYQKIDKKLKAYVIYPPLIKYTTAVSDTSL